MKTPYNDIEKLRSEVDEVDKQIKSLFIRRMEIAKEILECKNTVGISLKNSNREKQIEQKILKDNNIIIRKFFPEVSKSFAKAYQDYQDELIHSDKIYEQTLRIAYFGKGISNTYLGLEKMLLNEGYTEVNKNTFFKGNKQVLLYDTESMEDLKLKLLRKKVNAAFVPFFNSNMGVVMDTYHLLEKNDLHFLKRFTDQIVLYLYISKENNQKITSLYDVQKIYSNLSALSQCSEFVNNYLPFATFRKSISTTNSVVDMLNDKENIAVCFANDKVKNSNVERVKFWKGTTSNNGGSETTYILIGNSEKNQKLSEKKRDFADYYRGWYLYLSKNRKGKTFSVDAKSYRIAKIEGPSDNLKISVYKIDKKSVKIAVSASTRIYVDVESNQICFEYVYEPPQHANKSVRGTAVLRATEDELRNKTQHIFGEYKGENNGKAGILDFRRISKEEFDTLMGN